MPEHTRTERDPDQAKVPDRGPAGDARPNPDAPDPRTGGGQPAEPPEDRPNVGSVTPDDYPEKAGEVRP